MSEQLGVRGMLDRLKQESQRWPQLLPQLPRLAHAALEKQARPQRDPVQEALLARMVAEQRRTQRWIRIFALLLLAILLVQSWPWLAALL
jgi:ubiquinone biosynthesis protein